MNIDSIISDHEDLQEIVKCAILHEKGKKNVDIAEELGITSVKVTRNLQEAKEKGIMRIVITSPPDEKAANKILEKYKKFNLREAHVFQTGISDESVEIIPRLASSYIERLIDKNDKIKRVAIGPGKTNYEFVNSFSYNKKPEMVVESTTTATNIETHLASNILIGILASKWECGIHRYEVGKTCEELKDFADIFIFGIENIPDMNDVTAVALLSASKPSISRIDMEKKLHELAGNGAVGIMNYRPFDISGKPKEWDLKEYNNILRSTVIDLNIIRDMTTDINKKVICIVDNKDKAIALEGALRGGYINVLITDYETAKALLEM